MTLEVIHGDCLDVLPTLGERFAACVTDPPYELAFMGRKWDSTGVACRPETWRAVFGALLPGAHLVCFGGTRTWHRMACAIEDAGFEIRDTLCWLYGQGFPKSHNLDGNWQGWGTALKPAWEPIILARKPLASGTVAANVLAHGTGALNVDACRVTTDDNLNGGTYSGELRDPGEQRCLENRNRKRGIGEFVQPAGRWPANVLHDGSAEVDAAFAAFGESKSSAHTRHNAVSLGSSSGGIYGDAAGFNGIGVADTGTASRFFYTAKADKADRADSRHPTVKPVDLMRWLVRLVTPPGGAVLDPFAGSGTTGEAAMLESFDATLIECDATHAADIAHRIKRWSGLDAPLFEAAD